MLYKAISISSTKLMIRLNLLYIPLNRPMRKKMKLKKNDETCTAYVTHRLLPDGFVNFQGHLLSPSDRDVGLLVFVNFSRREGLDNR